MNPAQGSGNAGYNNGGGNGQMNQNALQQQLVQQLSQQLSQQMSQKFPQANILSALANVQSQMQNPQQQMPPELMAFAQSGNLANVAGILGGNNAAAPPAPTAPATAPPQQHPPPPAQQPQPPPPQQQTSSAPAAVAAPTQNEEVRQRLLQQLSKTAPPAGTPKDPPPSVPPSVGHVGEVRAGFQGHPSVAVSSNMTADAVKDERRKAPGSVIVPCRARGMPMDHNFKTAYFVIPENVRHGEELICSYFACRNAGVKFRYCSHCKVPVAKRNFRKRHKHGDNMGKDGGNDDDQSGTEEDGCSDEGESPEVPAVPSQVTTGRSSSSRKEAIPTQVTTTTEERVSKKNRSEERSKKSHIPSQVTTSNNSSGKKDKKGPSSKNKGEGSSGVSGRDINSICMRAGDDRGKVIETRRKRWAYLLEKRPQTKDGEAMSAWLMQVLAVSDLWKPLNESEKMPDASLDLIRECAQAGGGKKKKDTLKGSRGGRKVSGYDNAQATSNSDSPEKQGGNSAENSSNNDSDVQENDTEGQAGTNEEDRTPNKKRNSSLLLKKRPVIATKNNDDDEDKGEPPLSKVKR